MGSSGRNEGVYLMELCKTGIPVWAGISSVKKGAGGLEVKMSLENVSTDSYFYGEGFELKRLDGPNDRDIPFKENTG